MAADGLRRKAGFLSLPVFGEGRVGSFFVGSRRQDPTRPRFRSATLPEAGEGRDSRMRTDLFDFDLPPDRIALRPASPRDAARLLVVRPGAVRGIARTASCATCRTCCVAGDQLVVNDTKVIPAQLQGRRIGRGTRRRDRGDADQAARRRALAGAGQARAQARARRRRPVRRGGQGVLSRRARRHRRSEGRGRRGDLRLRLSRTDARCRDRRARRGAAAALHRRAPARPTSATVPTTRPCSPARRARWRRPPPACISRRRSHSPGSRRAAIDAAHRDPACRRRHLPAGEGRGCRRPQDACRMGRGRVPTTAAALDAARAAGRPHRRRRHHLAAAPRKRGARRRQHRAVLRRDRRSSSRPATASAPSTCS